MTELFQALETIKRYNRMSFDLFIKEYEAHIEKKFPLSIISDFAFTGLTNVAFIQLRETTNE